MTEHPHTTADGRSPSPEPRRTFSKGTRKAGKKRLSFACVKHLKKGPAK